MLLLEVVAVAVVGWTDTSEEDTATRRRSTSSNACSAGWIDTKEGHRDVRMWEDSECTRQTTTAEIHATL